MTEKPTYEELLQHIQALQSAEAERRQAEETLASERSFLSVVLDTIGEAIVICDKNGRLIRFNESARRLHGIPEHPIPPQQWSEYYSLYRADAITPLPTEEIPLFRALQGERVHNAEIVTVPKDGPARFMECNGQALINAEGEVMGAVIAMHDITERKKSEEKIRESERRFQKILNVVPDLISIHSPRMDILYSNWSGFGAVPASRRILNTKCYRTYRGYGDICPDCQAKQVLESGQALQKEVRLPDGKWFDVRVIPVLDRNGHVEMFMEWVRDITERKEAEKTLRESEQRYRDYFEEILSGAFISAPDGRLLDCNQEYVDMFGFSSRQEALDTSVVSLYEDPGRRDEFIQTLYEHKGIQRFESKMRKMDGTPIHIIENAVGLFDDNGNLITIRGYLLDITEQKNIETHLRQSQKIESVGRLAGGVAHDFNNMLSVILGNAEMALDQAGSNQRLQDNIREIQKAAQRSANVVRQLLAFARKQTIAPRVLDLNETVEEMLKMLHRLIGEDIELVWKPGLDLWPVKVDASQIDQILANLSVNARDAIAGVGRMTIETDKVRFDEAYCAEHPGFVPGDFVLLAVSDNGCGMDAETRKNLFEPFFTTKEVGKGTGLGLATVYGIVKQNKGFINIYSEPDHGTTVRIYLPRHQTEDRPDRAERAEPSERFGSETILLVEDEATILQMTRVMLEGLGYTVLAALTPGEAMEVARRHGNEIHLLITDVVMPEMNGRDLAGRLLLLYPDLKWLFMSGYTENAIAHHGVLDEGVNFIQKPFSKQGLSVKIRKVLDATDS